MNVQTGVENRLIFPLTAFNAPLGTMLRFLRVFTPRSVKTDHVFTMEADVDVKTVFGPERVIRDTGYFEGLGENPAYGPGETALCPVCDQPMGALSEQTTKARSLWVINGRCHFFYYHAACGEHGAARVNEFEGRAVDEIIAQENPQ